MNLVKGWWPRFGALVLGGLLVVVGVVVLWWHLVDPTPDEVNLVVGSAQFSGLVTPSLIVGSSVSVCGLVVIAFWAGMTIGRGRDAGESTETATAEASYPSRTRPLVGLLLMVVGALLLSFPGLGGVWSEIWYSTHKDRFIFYSVFQYFPVVVTFGVVVEVVGLCLCVVWVRSVVRIGRR